jgi:hypothetical protein
MEKRTEAVNIRLTISEIKQLETILKRTGKTFIDMVVERIVNYSQDEIGQKLSEILNIEDIHRDLFYELEVEDELRFNIFAYMEGDLIRTEKGNILVVVEILKTDNSLRCYLFPYISNDTIKIISLEANARTFINIFRKCKDE